MYENDDTSLVKSAYLTEIKDLLSKLPKTDKNSIPKLDFDRDSLCDATMDKSLIENNLNFLGWKKDIYDILSMFEHQTFSTKDYMQFLHIVKQKHPKITT